MPAWLIKKWFKRFKRLFGPPDGPGAKKHLWPDKTAIEKMPWFEGFASNDIVVIHSEQGAKRAYEEISAEDVVGFDTESKPTFKKGEVSNGPHVAQFASLKRAYIFPLHAAHVRKAACDLIHLKTLTKVGFGLDDDLKRIKIKLKTTPQSVIDLESMFRKLGYGRGVGVKVAVAIAFKRRFKKSRKAATSNWANEPLTMDQLLYAANDAYAPLRVYHALKDKKKP